MAGKPDRILLVPERRRRFRILTIRNVGYALVVLLIAFAAITIRSEMRKPSHGDYGRLFGRQVAKVEPVAQPRVEVVPETQPVTDATISDPMLLAPAAREQYLGATTTEVAPAAIQPQVRPGNADVAIVGGTSGVTVTTTAERRPVLSGGIFKQ